MGSIPPGLTVPRNCHDHPVPAAPFFGARQIHNVPLDTILPFVNEKRLFAIRWGYHRKSMEVSRYEAMIREDVQPRYQELLRRLREESLLEAGVAYGYFRACAEGDTLRLTTTDGPVVFTFPRQEFPPHRCLTDFCRTAEAGGDLIGAFAVTVGAKLSTAITALRAADRYQDYLMLHGLSVELAEALAESWHHTMRQEWGLTATTGARYSFGYAACPDLDNQPPLLDMLGADHIGITLTESYQMVPEASVSALVIAHPQAHYFSM